MMESMAQTLTTEQPLPHISEAPPTFKPYQPFGSSLQLMYCKDPEIVIDGPAGTGKSRAALEKIHLLCCKYPGARCLLVRKTRESLTQSAMVTFDLHVVPDNGTVTWRTTEQEYRYWNGSKIVVGGMDKASRIMSTEYDLIFVQEGTEISEAEYESLLTRVRNGIVPYNQLILDCNPSHSRHWVKRRWEEGLATRLASKHEDNPRWFDHEKDEWTEAGLKYLSVLDRLTGHRYQRLRKGLWVSAEGIVYPEFSVDIHVISPFKIPDEWRRIRSVDFGYTNPFCCQWWAFDNDDRMYLYREIYMSRRTVRAHAEYINELSEGEWIEATTCDWDAEDRATLEENDISTLPAEKSISVGVEKVKERLIPEEEGGKPRLFIFDNALVEYDSDIREEYKPTCTKEEFEDYVWADNTKKEIPVQVNNHGLDALRYAVMYSESSGQTGGIHV